MIRRRTLGAAHECEESNRGDCDVDEHELLVLHVLLVGEFGFGRTGDCRRVVRLIDGGNVVRVMVIFVGWLLCVWVVLVVVQYLGGWFFRRVVDLCICGIVVNINDFRFIVMLVCVVRIMRHVVIRTKITD